MEDLWDVVWKSRPEWARPAVGGIALGLVLLALPQMYGVGYPVMYKAVAGDYVLWFLLVLAVGKILACSLTLGIGGSGGVFAPSLFVGVTSGMAFGEIVDHVFGPGAGPAGPVRGRRDGRGVRLRRPGAADSVASVVEMTGDFTLTLPVMLAVAIATATSRALSYGTHLHHQAAAPRPGHRPRRALAGVRRPEGRRRDAPFPCPSPSRPQPAGTEPGTVESSLPGPVTGRQDPQALYAGESLAQTLRQLRSTAATGCRCCPPTAARCRAGSPTTACSRPSPPRSGPPRSRRPRPGPPGPASTPPLRRRRPLRWPATGPGGDPGPRLVGCGHGTGQRPLACAIPVAVLRHRSLGEPDPDLTLAVGDRVSLPVPAPGDTGGNGCAARASRRERGLSSGGKP